MNFKKFLFKHGTRRQRFYKKYRMHIPNVFTLSSALLGFTSLVFSASGNFVMAAYCILVGSAIDFLDGASARYLEVESIFGAQLDSLSDAISFCVAPAFMMYAWLGKTMFSLVFASATLFCLAGIVRLARFNAYQGDIKGYFIGLPTTAAALLVANITLLFQHRVVASSFVLLFTPFVAVLGVLMVGTVSFPSLKSIDFYEVLRRFFVSIAFISAAVLYYVSIHTVILVLFLLYFLYTLYTLVDDFH
jgi:CDP-diacylglycerol--serine O-phosphatidyltransferase